MKVSTTNVLNVLEQDEIAAVRDLARNVSHPPAFVFLRAAFIAMAVVGVLCFAASSFHLDGFENVGTGAAVLAALLFLAERRWFGNRDEVVVPAEQVAALRGQLRQEMFGKLEEVARRLTHDGPGDGVIRVRTLWQFLSESVASETLKRRNARGPAKESEVG
ncbi:hypothetical protein RA280_32450 [Cupriavidus sp. CV2]|uniref:hypothetical protein n=1 Tax=Cupriavidus ulmosensis TaxID=3065913 RepID=UPI00296B27FC|nr:hypothetical protein [Cupriavidus sp. CV2]MDW3686370.1 hypothetical protein [Cupriavidus sp. CV2]